MHSKNGGANGSANGSANGKPRQNGSTNKQIEANKQIDDGLSTTDPNETEKSYADMMKK